MIPHSRTLTSSRASLKTLFEIVHEDADLLVINKPAGLVCHPTKGDEYSSLISRVRLHVGAAAEPQLINRLDRETSGVTLVAKNAETALEIRRIWERRDVIKKYLAIVHGAVEKEDGWIDAPLGKDTRSPVAIKDCVTSGGAPAETRFRVGQLTARPRVRLRRHEIGHEPDVAERQSGTLTKRNDS